VVVQTLGTWLQLSGSVITLGGLLYAWHTVSTRWAGLRHAARERLTQLRNSIESWGEPKTPEPPPAGGSIGATLQPLETHMEGYVDHGGPDERFARLETELCSMADHIRELDTTLRTEIDNAIAVEREHVRVVQLRDISWTLGGIAVSIIGYACQLIG
jgi:hypothetical protein